MESKQCGTEKTPTDSTAMEYRVAREVLPNEVTFEQRAEGGRGVCHGAPRGRVFQT